MSTLFLSLPPLPFNPIDLDDIGVAMVAPLYVVQVDAGARYDINQAPIQGASAHLKEEEEIEGVIYNVIDEENDTNGDAEGDKQPTEKVEGVRHPYNLRRPRQPTFALYDNLNVIDDLDLDSSGKNSNVSTSTAEANTDAPEEVNDSFDVNLMQIIVAEKSRARTFGNVDNPRDKDKVRNMIYRYIVTQLIEHEEIAKHGKKAVEALMKE